MGLEPPTRSSPPPLKREGTLWNAGPSVRQARRRGDPLRAMASTGMGGTKGVEGVTACGEGVAAGR